MFNNNNYLPDLNHYPPTGQMPTALQVPQPPEPVPMMSGTSGLTHPSSGHFRFLSPTQVTAVPTWVPASTAVGVASAPGLGASWQHSIPTTMPWANQVAPHFTAQSMLSQSLPVYTMQMAVAPKTTMTQVVPKPSISTLLRRSKRRIASNAPDISEGPSSKRYLSESMAACFRQLQITPTVQQNGSKAGGDASGAVPGCLYDWQRFHELEKRLEEDLEIDESGTVSASAADGKGSWRGQTEAVREVENGAILTIPEVVKQELQNPDPVLPSHIMKNIANPCMDLVLWQPIETVISSSLCPAPNCSAITISNSSSQGSVSVQSSAASVHQQQQQQQQQQSFVFTNSLGHHTHSSIAASQFNSAVADMDMFDLLDDDDMDL